MSQLSHTFWNELKIELNLQPSYRGIQFTLSFSIPSNINAKYEIWFPIEGNLSYYRKDLAVYEHLCKMFDSTMKYIDNNKILIAEDYLLQPGQSNYVTFMCIVEQDVASRLFNYIFNKAKFDLEIPFRAWFVFNVLKDAGTISQKTYLLRPVFVFSIKRDNIVQWLSQWYTFYVTTEEDLSKLPSDVADNFLEVIRCFNAGAYRATVAMARRTLELALEDKNLKKPGEAISDFIKKCRQNKENCIIDSKTLNLMDAIRVFGNYGAHPNDDLLADIDSGSAKIVVEILKSVLKELYK